MLNINLSPVAGKPETQVSWAAPILTVNNEPYDLSILEDGATATGHPVLGDVSRTGDNYECTILLGHGKNALKATRFPAPLTVTQDGAIELPLYDVVPEFMEVPTDAK